MTTKTQAKHDKQTPKLAALPMHPENTANAAEKAKNESREAQQRTSTGEIEQNLLSKIQVTTKNKTKTQTQNPTQNKFMSTYIPNSRQKRTGIGVFMHHIKSFETLATCVQKHTCTLSKNVN